MLVFIFISFYFPLGPSSLASRVLLARGMPIKYRSRRTEPVRIRTVCLPRADDTNYTSNARDFLAATPVGTVCSPPQFCSGPVGLATVILWGAASPECLTGALADRNFYVPVLDIKTTTGQRATTAQELTCRPRSAVVGVLVLGEQDPRFRVPRCQLLVDIILPVRKPYQSHLAVFGPYPPGKELLLVLRPGPAPITNKASRANSRRWKGKAEPHPCTAPFTWPCRVSTSLAACRDGTWHHGAEV